MQLILLFAALFLANILQAQTIPPGSKKLTLQQQEKLLPDSVVKRLGIKYPVYAVFGFMEKNKQRYLLLAEKEYKKENEKSLNDAVQAMILSEDNGMLQSELAVNDFISPGKNSNGFTDYSIWFWTKYIRLTDIDGDGSVDPVIVYGTAGSNNYDDGKIKIITIYKGRKYAIRHQNGSLDFERNTNVDKEWYSLPVKIQSKLKSAMIEMTGNGHAIFPAGWQKAMAAKKTYFDEN